MSRLVLPRHDRPDLSVVMVTHNAWDWTARALSALVENTEPSFELIVVDNASSDGTPEELAAIEGATVLRNRVNHGFGPAANQGAMLARAPHLVFLNNDALVRPGWLPPLRAILDAEPDVAVAAPRLLHLDGSVQEAGSIVWGDGEVWPYGATRPAGCPECRFRRDVDYASGACLLLRRSAFVEVGGFHPRYAPAYYEDVDLCLAMWERGLRTVCQPASEVTHAGGASTASGWRAQLLARNRPRFEARWRQLLARRPRSPVHWEPEDLLPGRDIRCADRVLVIGDFVPGAREPRLGGLLHALVRLWPRGRMTYLALDPDDAEASAPSLLAAGVELAWPGDTLDAWLAQRRHHYGVVVAASFAAAMPPVRGQLEATQPRAHRVLLLDRGLGRDLDHEGYREALRSARLLLCEDQDQGALAARAAPLVELAMVPADPAGEPAERALVAALARLGMAS